MMAVDDMMRLFALLSEENKEIINQQIELLSILQSNHQ